MIYMPYPNTTIIMPQRVANDNELHITLDMFSSENLRDEELNEEFFQDMQSIMDQDKHFWLGFEHWLDNKDK